MKQLRLKINDPIGLYGRPASIISVIASKSNSDISITNLRTNVKGNLKSIMSIISLGIKKGDEALVVINGKDEEEMFIELSKAFRENLIVG